jgi:hypothetical protein
MSAAKEIVMVEHSKELSPGGAERCKVRKPNY